MWQGRVNFKYGRQLGRGKEEAWARERGRGGEPGGGSRGRTCRQAWCSRADAGAGAGAALQVGAVAVAGSQEERTGWVASPGESIAAGEGEEKGGQGRVDGGGRGEEGEEGGGRTTARTPRRSTAQHSAAQRSAAQRLLVVVVALAAGSVLCAPLAAQRDHSGVKVDVGQAAHHQAGGGVRVSLADCGAPGGGGGIRFTRDERQGVARGSGSGSGQSGSSGGSSRRPQRHAVRGSSTAAPSPATALTGQRRPPRGWVAVLLGGDGCRVDVHLGRKVVGQPGVAVVLCAEGQEQGVGVRHPGLPHADGGVVVAAGQTGEGGGRVKRSDGVGPR